MGRRATQSNVRKKKAAAPRWVVPCAAVALLVLAGAALIGAGASRVAAVIDGTWIPVRQYQSARNRVRAQVLSELPGGDGAEREIKSRALRTCAGERILLGLAHREGILPYDDYNGLIRAMEEENKAREQTAAAGGVVYGVPSYSEQTYREYVFSNAKKALIPLLREKELRADEEELRAWYEKNKGRVAEAPASAEIAVFTLDAPAGNRAEAKKTMEALRQALEAGADPAAAAEQYGLQPYTAVFTPDNRTAQRDPQMAAAALALETGRVSALHEKDGGFQLLYCMKARPARVLPYEEVEAAVREQYGAERLEAYLREQAAAARILENPFIE